MKFDIFGVHIWKFYFTIRWYSGVKWWEWGFRRLGSGRWAIDTWSLAFIFEYYG